MKLTLRQKVFYHFIIFTVITCTVWILIYFSFSTLNQKLQLIDRKNDLFNIVLEARRYEKNFFLRNEKKDLKTALSYINQAASMQEKIENRFTGYIHEPGLLKERTLEINSYRTMMTEFLERLDLEKSGRGLQDAEITNDFQKKITRLGRRITSETERIEDIEKARLYNLLEESKKYLLISLFVFILLALITSFFLTINVGRPLKVIENGIKKISRGDYSKIPQINTGDEFESLAQSLNNMIFELNKRSDQLLQAEKMSSLGTLTSGVAHELNNPLNNISTSVQIVLEEMDDPDIEYKKELLKETEKQVDRARDIVKALLEFSRQSEFSSGESNFKKLVDNTMYLIKGDIPSNIELKINIPDDINVKIDSSRIQQVLINLILNSIHAMEDGGTLDITACENQSDDTFTFKVKDTGRGIDKENINKIFDPFFTTKEVGKGSGLGLSIIHGIIERHGGTIEVRSEPCKGTEFAVHLPR
ncbi:MAG: HAMP domain-containing sensor histidine kinase [Desulfobacteraceae bacterium]